MYNNDKRVEANHSLFKREERANESESAEQRKREQGASVSESSKQSTDNQQFVNRVPKVIIRNLSFEVIDLMFDNNVNNI